MTPQDFIRKNVSAELSRLGYEHGAVMKGADMAVDHYRRCSQASRRGRIFDDCLYIAKLWAGKQKSKDKR
ncbi:hypothetical protein [Lonsdalea quercina]|uniref:hypothetical protein n=1 Tax=Lonsdalea quercina TaxID=71657 RepID=UPI003977155C